MYLSMSSPPNFVNFEMAMFLEKNPLALCPISSIEISHVPPQKSKTNTFEL